MKTMMLLATIGVARMSLLQNPSSNINKHLALDGILAEHQHGFLNNLEKTDPSEIERTYNTRKQHTQLYSVCS